VKQNKKKALLFTTGVCVCVWVWVGVWVGVWVCVGVWVWACVTGETLRHTDICELLDEKRHVEEGLVTPDSIVPVFFILDLYYFFNVYSAFVFPLPESL